MHGEHNQQHSDVHALMRDVANGLLTQHPQVAIVGLELIPKQNITDAIKFVDFESTALNGDAAAAATTSAATTTATSSAAATTRLGAAAAAAATREPAKAVQLVHTQPGQIPQPSLALAANASSPPSTTTSSY